MAGPVLVHGEEEALVERKPGTEIQVEGALVMMALLQGLMLVLALALALGPGLGLAGTTEGGGARCALRLVSISRIILVWRALYSRSLVALSTRS